MIVVTKLETPIYDSRPFLHSVNPVDSASSAPRRARVRIMRDIHFQLLGSIVLRAAIKTTTSGGRAGLRRLA
jgi:hypothetical protein